MEKKKNINLKDMKNINKAAVLKSIWKNGELSRSELAEKTGLSPATITALTEELLLENRIIETVTGESSGGRKPMMLRINPVGGYICAVNISTSCIVYDLINFNLEKIAQFKEPISEEIILQSLYESLIARIDILLKESGIAAGKLIGIGISFPDSLYRDISKKVMLDTGISADRMEIDEALRYRYKTPVFIQSEIDAKAIAEYYLGAVKNPGGFIYMEVGEHIQVRIVYDGKLMNSPLIKNEDLGHMIIDRNGPKCECGKRGCLDVMASFSALIKKIVKAMNSRKRAETGRASEKLDIDYINSHSHIYEEDHIIKTAIAEVADALYAGMLYLSSIFSIRNFVVGGKIRRIDCFAEALNKVNDQYSLSLDSSDGNKITIQAPAVSDNSINIGNGAVVLSNFFV